MHNLHVRLNLDRGKENKSDHHSSKEPSKIAKFGWPMLYEKIYARILIAHSHPMSGGSI